jgi:hypothetical protein
MAVNSAFAGDSRIVYPSDKLSNCVARYIPARLLHGPDSVRLSASQELRDAVENCLSQLTAIKMRLEPNKTSKAMSLVGVRALKWPFQSKEVEKVLKNLERCTQTVSLALGVDQLWVMNQHLLSI